jgi:hypothetical protein
MRGSTANKLNTNNPQSNTQREKTGEPQKYTFDMSKITAVYNFCIEINVLSNTVVWLFAARAQETFQLFGALRPGRRNHFNCFGGCGPGAGDISTVWGFAARAQETFQLFGALRPRRRSHFNCLGGCGPGRRRHFNCLGLCGPGAGAISTVWDFAARAQKPFQLFWGLRPGPQEPFLPFGALSLLRKFA